MHPLHHAKSSAKRLGGQVEHYLPIHAWLDESKQAFCSPMHRAYRHNIEILPELTRVFGSSLSSNRDISMKAILDDHLMEDCKGTTPSIADWFMRISSKPWMRRNNHMSTQDSAQAIADKFGGLANEYLPICQFMDEGKSVGSLADWRHRAWRWHGFGTFDAERKFGTSFKNTSGRTVIVRYVAEKHIQVALGRLPSMQDWYENIRMHPFMAGNHVIAGSKTVIIEKEFAKND